jgi:predicted amidohydrolase
MNEDNKKANEDNKKAIQKILEIQSNVNDRQAIISILGGHSSKLGYHDFGMPSLSSQNLGPDMTPIADLYSCTTMVEFNEALNYYMSLSYPKSEKLTNSLQEISTTFLEYVVNTTTWGQVQFEIRPSEGPENVDRAIKNLKEKYLPGTDFIVFPESMSVSFVQYAEDNEKVLDDGTKLLIENRAKFAQAAKDLGTHIIYGEMLVDIDPKTNTPGPTGYNKSVMVDETGNVFEYTKMHLWGNEGAVAGDKMALWKTKRHSKDFNIRPLVCSDMEHWKDYLTDDADAYVVIANFDQSALEKSTKDIQEFREEAAVRGQQLIIVDNGGVPYQVPIGEKDGETIWSPPYGANMSSIHAPNELGPLSLGKGPLYTTTAIGHDETIIEIKQEALV